MSQCDAPGILTQSEGLPRSGEGEPIFGEPWQAQAFAMTVHLYEKGIFTWVEWAANLSREVHRAERAADGSDYFEAWVAALCHLLVEKGLADLETIAALAESWKRAAEATPHGKPIEITNDPARYQVV